MLTNGTDTATANIFNSGLVYNPAGTDRINALQSEDALTGTGTNPTLNAVLGNANDNGSKSVTPTLKNIETINLDITGNTNTLDVRFADSLKSLSINKLTAEATSAVTIANIGQPAANLAVKNSALVDNTISFNYVDGVLAGTAANPGSLTLSNVQAALIHVGNEQGATDTEGFENLTLASTGTNVVKSLEAIDLENLTINGSGSLSLLQTTPAAEHVAFTAGQGIAIGDGIGIRTIDASSFSGTLNIDVSNAVGKHTDPANSGAPYYAVITGGTGNDTFWTGTNITAESATLLDTIDGGAGANTVRTYASILPTGATNQFNAKITNVQTLELRQNTVAQTADLDAFDTNLNKIILRDENSANAIETFTLNSVTKAIAEGGNIVLRHAADSLTLTDSGDTWGGLVNINLKDASGASDTVVVKVENDLNQETKFDYTLAIKSDANTATTVVENVTINDADTESNIVTLTNAQEHTGTVTLLGGVAGQKFVVNSTLDAKTIDAAAQLSDVTLRVGDTVAPITTIDQTIKLGAGSDTLVFDTANDLNGADTITDAGGTDTAKAFYSVDATYAINLAGVEKFHTVSTSNATLDLAKSTGITEFAFLSDEAVDLAGETFAGALAGVQVTDIVTLNNSNLSTLNFFGDVGDLPAADQTAQIFNGVTLANNSATALTVNINSSLDKNGFLEGTALEGSLAYNLGQLTAHGITAMTIAVTDERKETVSGKAAGVATTDVDNIYSKSMSSLTVTARDNVDLGVITGSATNNSLTKIDASGVGKAFTANVISLGDSAVVTMGNGNNVFSALGSGGKNVSITAGNGKNTVTGTAQSDTITTGSSNDIINGDRGDNIIVAGAGDDTITAKDGNNVLNVGSGLDTVTLNNTTGLDATKATNTVTGTGMTTLLTIDGDGAGTAATDGDDFTGYVAVGDGAEVSLKFTGNVFDAAASTLNGRTAIAGGAATDTQAEIAVLANYSTTNSNLIVFTTNPTAAETFITGSAADVVIDLSAGPGNAYNVSTGAGNDAIVMSNTNAADHTLTGGAGADRIVLSAGAIATSNDTIVIADGDSLAASYDQVTNFVANLAAAGGDTLDVSTAVVGLQASLAAVTSTASGAPITVGTTIVAGVVTAFGLTDVVGTAGAEATAIVSSAADANAADTVGVISLSQALTYLATSLNGTGMTVAFTYDYNGDGTVGNAGDHTIVFTDGAADTVVDLVGLVGVTAVATAAAANAILIA